MTVWAKPGGASGSVRPHSFPRPELRGAAGHRPPALIAGDWEGPSRYRRRSLSTVPHPHDTGCTPLAVLLPPKSGTGLSCAPNYKCPEMLPETQPLRLGLIYILP